MAQGWGVMGTISKGLHAAHQGCVGLQSGTSCTHGILREQPCGYVHLLLCQYLVCFKLIPHACDLLNVMSNQVS